MKDLDGLQGGFLPAGVCAAGRSAEIAEDSPESALAQARSKANSPDLQNGMQSLDLVIGR